MTTIPMWPPTSGLNGVVSFDGRSYASVPGIAIPVQSFDVNIMEANGWTRIPPIGYTLPSTSIAPQKLYKFRAALGRQATGGAPVKIACCGDSITAGALSDASPGNYRKNSWPKLLADYLTAAGYPASSANMFCANAGSQAGGQSPGLWDNRLSSTGGWATITATFFLFGGMTMYNAGSIGTIVATPGTLPIAVDTCDIWFFDQGAVWTATASSGGGNSPLTITGGNTVFVRKVTLTFTATTTPVTTLSWVSGSGSVIGFNFYSSTTSQIQILNGGSGGTMSSTTNAVSAIPTDPNLSYYGMAQHLAPDLTIINWGANDSNAGQMPIDTFKSNIQTFITGMQVSGDVILMTFCPWNLSTNSLAVQAPYLQALADLAVSNGISLIDENFNLVSKATMTANGLGSDAIHPNNIGHAVIARDVYAAILAGI